VHRLAIGAFFVGKPEIVATDPVIFATARSTRSTMFSL
jgi:hypothetical protein